jgi:hypothetical protein
MPRGKTIRDINENFHEIYGPEASPRLISKITEPVGKTV